MSKKVYVVGGDDLVIEMFAEKNWDISYTLENASLVCFTGGADVSPNLYGHKKHFTTQCAPKRDEIEVKVFKEAHNKFKPMVGICRGGQFLNVMNGGTMYQDVNNHTRTHILKDILSDTNILVTSTHHQMMIPAEYQKGSNKVPIIIATASESTIRETDTSVFNNSNIFTDDTEVVYYPETRSLCFQPHPEYGLRSCREYFFSLLDRFELGV